MEKYALSMYGQERIFGIVYDDTDLSWHLIDLKSDVVKYTSYRYPEDIITEFENLYQKGLIDGYRKVD